MIAAGQAELFSADGLGGAGPAGGAGPVLSWLEEVLLADLAWRRSAVARLAPCRKCQALTLHATDSTWAGLTEVTVDPRLLDRGLEVQALLAGRGTAELEVRGHGGGPLIFSRDRWLAAREPNARRRLWVPEHVCGQPVGWELPLELVYPFESRRRVEASDVPPF